MGFRVRVGSQSERQAALLASLPKIDGHYIAPQYVPGHKRARFESELFEWCAVRPEKHWPDFVADWINAKSERRAEVERRITAARPGMDLAGI